MRLLAQRDAVALAQPDVQSVRLEDAVLCEDCGWITAAWNGGCALCGSQAVLRHSLPAFRPSFSFAITTT